MKEQLKQRDRQKEQLKIYKQKEKTVKANRETDGKIE